MADFVQALSKMAAGSLLATLNERLTDVVEAVHETNKVGSLTLKLKLSPNGENGITIEDDISIKLAQPNRGKSLFFTDGSNLLRTDPRQSELFEAKVVGGTGANAGAEEENAVAG